MTLTYPGCLPTTGNGQLGFLVSLFAVVSVLIAEKCKFVAIQMFCAAFLDALASLAFKLSVID